MNGISGSWLRGQTLESLSWREAELEVSLQRLQLQLELPALLEGRLLLREASAAELAIIVATSADAAPTAEPIPLPTVALPHPLRLEAPTLQLQRLRIRSGDSEFELQGIATQLYWRGSRIQLARVAVSWQQASLSGDGELRLHGDYPLRLQSRLQHPQLPAATAVRARGSLRQLRLRAELGGTWPLQLRLALAPLDPELPLQLRASSTAPVGAGAGDDRITLKRWTLEADGTLAALDGRLSADTDDSRYGAGQWRGQLSLRDDQLALRQLRWRRGDADTLALDCDAALTPGRWHCAGALHELPLQPLFAQPAIVSTDLQLSGQWAPQWALTAALNNIRGHWRDTALSGELQLQGGDGRDWQLRQLLLRSGDNQLQGKGRLGAHSELTVQLQLPAPQQLYPPLQGRLHGDLRLAGRWPEPDLSGQLRGDNLRYGDWQLRQLRGEFALPRLGLAAGQLRLTLQELAGATPAPINANLRAEDSRQQHRLQLALNDSSGGELQLRCQQQQRGESYALDCPQLSGRFAAVVGRDITGPATAEAVPAEPVPAGAAADKPATTESVSWQAEQALALQWQWAPWQLQVQPLCLSADSARLCLEKSLQLSAGDASASAELSGLPLRWFTPYLPRTLRLEQGAQAAATLELSSLQPPRGRATLTVPATRWQWTGVESEASASLEKLSATLALEGERAQLRAGARSPELGELTLDMTVTEPAAARRLAGEFRFQRLQLAALEWLLPRDYAMSGTVDGRAQLGGSLSQPLLDGGLRLRGGQLQLPLLAEPLREVELRARFDAQRADFNGSFEVAGGNGNLRGQLQLPGAQPWQLQAALETSKITLQPLPESSLTLSSDLTLKADAERAHLAGSIDVERADIQLRQLPPDSQRLSPDSEIVGRDQSARQQLSGDVQLRLGDAFHFRGFGADVYLAGRLRAQQQPGRGLETRGEVAISRGRYRAYGQRLLVRRGSFLFNGPLDNPDLDLEAVREMPPASTLTVGVQVTGPLQSPSAALFSQPSLPETDTAYYLLTGKPPPSFGASSPVSAESALLAIGLAGTGERAAKVAERFGISDFEIGAETSDEGTEAQLSGYLSPRLYVRYGTGTAQRAGSVTFQYRLAQRLLLEAVSGLDHSLDLLYSFSVD